MLGIIALLLVVWLTLAVIGFVVETWFWLTLVGIALLLITAAFGWVKHDAGHR